MQDDISNSVIQMLNHKNETSGAGFLIAEDLVITTHYNVSYTLGFDEDSEPPSDAFIRLRFPFSISTGTIKAAVNYWSRDTQISTLRLLQSISPINQPAKLAKASDIWGHTFRTYGFPVKYDEIGGIWADGTIRGRMPNEWIQLEVNKMFDQRLGLGFGGSPVYDDSLGRVVGLIVASVQGDRLAFMIPAEKIADSIGDIVVEQFASTPIQAFLCHAKPDKIAVRHLYARLKEDGFNPWFDEEDLVPGQKWEYEIRKAVRASDAIIVCLSKNATNKSGFIQKEIRMALDAADEKPEGQIFIIPLKLEVCAVPERLQSFQWVDLYKERGYARLKSALTFVCKQG